MKKMILVDPAHMLLKTSPVPDILSETVLSLDDEIRQVLESQTLNEHDKASVYQQTLQKYLTKVNQSNTRALQSQPYSNNTSRQISDLNVPKENNTPMEEKTVKFEKRVVDSLPKTLQKKGGVLLDHIKDTTDLTWNDRGELIVKGQTIGGSNVSDLIHEILRARKLGYEPKGWSIFADSLRDSNVPIDLIGNKLRWDASSGVSSSIPIPSELTTPTNRKGSAKRGRRRQDQYSAPSTLKWQNF